MQRRQQAMAAQADAGGHHKMDIFNYYFDMIKWLL
jgi:hypothetical protein